MRSHTSFFKPFVTNNGVKKGGVLSTVLFTLSIDKLLNRLRQSKLGCYVGDIWMPVDFNVLASPFNASLKYKNNNESRVFQTFKANRPVDLKEVVSHEPSNHRLSGNQWEHSL